MVATTLIALPLIVALAGAPALWAAQDIDVGLIHPTILTARVDQSHKAARMELGTRAANYLVVFNISADMSKGQLILSNLDYNWNPSEASHYERPRPGYFLDISASTTDPGKNRSVVSYDAERIYAYNQFQYQSRQGNVNSSMMLYPNSCHLQIFRAFDRFTGVENGKPFYGFLGITDSSLCLAKYNDDFPGSVPIQSDREFTEELNNMVAWEVPLKFFHSSPQDIFRISATGVRELHNNFNEYRAFVFDEAGHMWAYKFNKSRPIEQQAKEYTGGSKKFVVSLIQLVNDKDAEIPYFLKNKYQRSKIETEIDRYEGGLARLKLHFNHSFIEAATIIDNQTMCYSRGFYMPNDNLITCIGEDNDKLMAKLAATQVYDYSILAIERVRGAENKLYYHIVYNTFVHMRNHFETKVRPSYWYCSITNGNTTGIEFPKNSTNCTNYDDLKRAPLDIVHYKTDKCDTVLALFPSSYQVFRPDQSLISDSHIFDLATWMKFPLNAAMFSNGKFYFFTSGNTVLVVRPEYKEGCLLDIQSMPMVEYQASEMLLQFRRLYGSNYNSAGPVYSGYDHYQDNKWQSTLFAAPEPIKQDDLIVAVPPVTVTPTSPPTPAPNQNGKSSSLNTVIIGAILLILFAFASGLIYYFFFAGKEREQSVIVVDRQKGKSPATKTASFDSALTVRSSMGRSSPQVQSKVAGAGAEPVAKSKQLKTVSGRGPARKRSPGAKSSVSVKTQKSLTKSPISLKSAKSEQKSSPSVKKASKSAKKNSPRSPKSAKKVSPPA